MRNGSLKAAVIAAVCVMLLSSCGREEKVQTHETATMTEQGAEIIIEEETSGETLSSSLS